MSENNTTMMMETANEVLEGMKMLENEEQRKVLMGFFKTGKGEYGEGDKFLGLKVPETRLFVREARNLPLAEVQKLINSRWHEARLCGFLILVDEYNRKGTSEGEREHLVKFYLRHAKKANNWDLVDMSCYKILGQWLVHSSCPPEEKLKVMDRLAESENLWEQRISMVSTMAPLKYGDSSYTKRYAEYHLHHSHDLMHKAVGWLLREMGKRCSMDELRAFLTEHAHEMPRTALRYAIEKMELDERNYWMRY